MYYITSKTKIISSLVSSKLKKIFSLITILLFFNSYGQDKILFSSDNAKIAFQTDKNYLTLEVTDYYSNNNNQNVRKGTVADFTENNFIMLEFDTNNNNKYDKDDIGIYVIDYNYSIVGYSLYEGFQGLRMHSLNKRFDKKTYTQLLNYVDNIETKSRFWKVKIPLTEIVKDLNKSNVGLQVSIHRNGNNNGTFLELPNGRNSFINTIQIPINTGLIKKSNEENLKKIKADKNSYTIKQIRKNIQYDGVFIENQQGIKYELNNVDFKKGKVVGLRGGNVINNYLDTYILNPDVNCISISTPKKIIISGSSFQGEFLKYVSFHKLEKLKDKKIIKYDSFNQLLDITVIYKQGNFNSSVDNSEGKSLYSPEVNSLLNDFISIPFKTKSISDNKTEIYFNQPLEKGKIYCLWSRDSWYLFEIN